MTKINKLLFGLLLVLITTNVYADTISVDSTKHGITDENAYLVTNTGTLTVSGVVSEDSFQAYKLLDAYYNSDTNSFSYEFTTVTQQLLDDNEFSASAQGVFNLSGGSIVNGSTQSYSQLDFFASLYTRWIKAADISGIDLTVNGTTATAENLTAGMYLILPTSTNKVYAVMVGNVEFKEESGDWSLFSDTIVAKVSDAGITAMIEDTLLPSESYNIGEIVKYEFVVTTPIYPTNATNKTISIQGTIAPGLTINLNSAVLSCGDTVINRAAPNYILDDNNNPIGYKFDLTLNDEYVGEVRLLGDGSYTFELLADVLDDNIITFTADMTVNNNAVLGPTGNEITGSITYANDPYGTGTTTTDDAIVTAYTYGISLFAKNSNDDGLEGVVYKIYSDSEYTDEIGTITTDNTGYGSIDGLKEDTYYIKQIKAANGYKLNSEGFSLTIDDTVDYTEQAVLNERASLLPATGGIGTYIFIATGLILITGAFIFLLLNRKKRLSV